MIPSLRPYQQQAVDALRQSFGAGRLSPVLVAPTGSGKTVMFSYIAKNAVERGNRVCILVHRRELLLQASSSLTAIGVEHGLIAPGFNRTTHPVQVASVQTLVRRLQHYPFDLIVIDECHHASSQTYRRIIADHKRARLLGVTATPCRSDGQGLSDIFDDMVEGPSMRELIDLGYLVRPVVYAPPVGIDMTGVRKRGGDFDRGEMAERVDKPSITGDVVGHYARLCGGQPAIAFCVSVAHAEHVAAQFRDAGFKARSVDGNMTPADRADAIAALGRGDLHVLTSCDIISEGTDVPVVSAAILLRPTQSLGLYIQQVGRALRTAPGKDKAIILDHVGNVLRHGMPDQDRDWTLDGAPKKQAANDNVASVRQCERCYFVFKPAPVCPSCGHQHEINAREVQQQEGELIELTAARAEQLKREQKREVGQARTLEQLEEIAKRRGYKPGWARFIMQSRQKKYG